MQTINRAFGALLLTFSVGCGGEALSAIQHAPPVAVAGPAQSARVGDTVHFDGSASKATGATLTGWAWSFGDGASVEGVRQTHQYTTTGEFQVTLTVTDSTALSASASTSVTVSAALPVRKAPTAIISGPNAAQINAPITLDATKSTADLGGTIVGWSWDWGDGSTATTETASHPYATTGGFTVKLTVTDDAGLSATSDGWIVRVTEPTAVLPSHSKWVYDLVNSADRSDVSCGPFASAPLTIDIPTPTAVSSSITIVEAGGTGGSSTYTGTYTSGTRHFSGNHSLAGGGTDTLAGTFSTDYTKFTGTYTVVVALLGCNRTRAVSGTRTSP